MKAWYEDDAVGKTFGPTMLAEELWAEVDAILELIEAHRTHPLRKETGTQCLNFLKPSH